MVNKAFIITAALCMALSGTAFASGQKEPAAAQAAPAQAGPAAQGQDVTADSQKLVLTGALAFRNLIHPTLTSGDKVYELMVPRRLVYQAGVKEGTQVTVEGYQLPDRFQGPWAEEDGNIHVFVTKATVDGKDYDLSQFRGPGYGWGRGYGRGWGRGMMGGGWGMMGSGFGPGGGRGMMGGGWGPIGAGAGFGPGGGYGCGF